MTISHSELAANFANGHRSGEASNMFIDEDIIYSYGRHFPIAKRIPGGYIYNSNKYSVSTAKHQSRVWSAIQGSILWEAPGCDENEAFGYYTSEVAAALRKIPRSRAYFPYYLDNLQRNLKQALAAAKEFKTDIQPLYDLIDSELGRDAVARIRKENAAFPDLLETFGKAQFFRSEELKTGFFKPDSQLHTITLLP